MFRFFQLSHRYLGIVVGLVMTIWCLSGFVMMYVPFPEMNQSKSLQQLAPLKIDNCCQSSVLDTLTLVDIHQFSLEMMGEELVLRIHDSSGKNPVVRLNSDLLLVDIDETHAASIVHAFETVAADTSLHYKSIESDQWTVTNYYNRHRPLHRFEDSDGSHWYISSKTGELIQQTSKSERFWNWLGAIPHWLYPSILRQHNALWFWTVVIVSILGTFLTLFGLYLGIARFKKLPSGRYSPYKGFGWWHHISGVFFGVFVLTWVFSGLISMNPWQWFNLSGGMAVRETVRGIPLSQTDVEKFIQNIKNLDLPQGAKKVIGLPWQSQLTLLVYTEQSVAQYSPKTGKPSPISAQVIREVVETHYPVESFTLLENGDNYYYSGGHEGGRSLPVYRAILDNDEQTRIYFDTVSGQVSGHYDKQQRWYRWLFSGLHEIDVASVLRQGPIRYGLLWFLMIGVTVATITGTWLGAKRLLGRN